MPIKLNLNLSRSKNEIPEETTGTGTGTPTPTKTNNPANIITTTPNIDVIASNYGNGHGHIINGNVSASSTNNSNTFLSPPRTSKFVDNINMDFSEQILKREYSSKSLFSLDNGKVHLVTKLNPQTLMRKSETVLALTNCTSTLSTTTPTLSNVKTVKDRIISSSSNALNSLINSSTSKLFGFKFNGNSKSSGKSAGGMTTNEEIFVVRSNSTAKVAPAPAATSTAVGTAPMTPTNRLRRNWSARRLNGIGLCSNTSLNSISCQELDEENETIACRLCLSNVKLLETVQLQRCSCRYCRDVSSSLVILAFLYLTIIVYRSP